MSMNIVLNIRTVIVNTISVIIPVIIMNIHNIIILSKTI